MSVKPKLFRVFPNLFQQELSVVWTEIYVKCHISACQWVLLTYIGQITVYVTVNAYVSTYSTLFQYLQIPIYTLLKQLGDFIAWVNVVYFMKLSCKY